MCGIVAIASLNERPVDFALAGTMANSIAHRGPDSSGLSIVDAVDLHSPSSAPLIVLGHRRLAIIDLSAMGNQPMSWDGLTVVFNGEIYNYLELRAELQGMGHSFVSTSDTEVILHALRQWGWGAVARFNGIFAFIVWDGRSRRLVAVRDRLGVKPLYYAESAGRLILASEIKAILSALGETPPPNERAIHDFMMAGRVDHLGETFFQGIQPLPAGCSLTLEQDRFSIERYWSATITEERHNRPFRDNVDEFKSLFLDSVNLQMRSDVPIACCLSGGLDSSSVVSVAARHAGAPLSVFTARYRHPPMDEWSFAQAVHRKSMVRPVEVYAEPGDFWEDLDRLITAQEEPFGGPGVYAQWRVMQAIHAAGIKVVLDGQGGDELLCGYAKYFYFQLRDLAREGRLLRAGWLAAGSLVNGGPQLFSITAAKRYLPQSWWINRENRILCTEDFIHRLGPLPDLPALRTVEDLQLADLTRLGLPSLLRYEDKNAMAHSVESRVPFLDHRLVEFALSVPTDHKLTGGRTKLLLREALKGILPEKVRKRRSKLGFGGSWHLWIRDLRTPLAAWLAQRHLPLDGYARRDALRRLQASHDPGLFRMLILDRWLDKHYGNTRPA